LLAGDVLESRRAHSLIEELDAIEIIRRRRVAEDPLTARTQAPRSTRANTALVLALVLIRLRKLLEHRSAHRQLERKLLRHDLLGMLCGEARDERGNPRCLRRGVGPQHHEKREEIRLRFARIRLPAWRELALDLFALGKVAELDVRPLVERPSPC